MNLEQENEQNLLKNEDESTLTVEKTPKWGKEENSSFCSIFRSHAHLTHLTIRTISTAQNAEMWEPRAKPEDPLPSTDSQSSARASGMEAIAAKASETNTAPRRDPYSSPPTGGTISAQTGAADSRGPTGHGTPNGLQRSTDLSTMKERSLSLTIKPMETQTTRCRP